MNFPLIVVQKQSCLSCEGIDDPSKCVYITTCSDNEVIFTRRSIPHLIYEYQKIKDSTDFLWRFKSI